MRTRVATGIYRVDGPSRSYQIAYQQRMTDGTTKQVWKGGFATIAAARKERTRLLAEQDRGWRATPGKVTFEQAATKWLAQYATEHPQSWRLRECSVRLHLLPTLGHRRIDSITRADVQAVIDSIEAPYAKRDAYIALTATFKWCQKADLLAINPATHATAGPVPTPAERVVLSAEQVAAYTADPAARGVMLTCALTGCRHGEARAMLWQDVSGDEWTITGSRGERSGAPVGPPKTKGSRRVVHLPAALRLRMPPTRATGLVWPARSADTERDAHFLLVERLGLPRVTPHGLRHSWGSIALAEGVPLKVVSEQLGHVRLATTSDIYSHVSGDMARTGAVTVMAAIEAAQRGAS